MKALLLFLAVAVAIAESKRYDGYSVIEVKPKTTLQNDALRELMNSKPELDFWREPSSLLTPVHIMASRQHVSALQSTVQMLGLNTEIIVDNVQAMIDEEQTGMANRRAEETYDYSYDGWNNYTETMAEIRRMAADCPADFVCEVQTIGQSVEGRDIDVLIIDTGRDTGRSFWVDSLIHAREWLAGATTMNIFNRLIREYDTDAEARAIVDRYDKIYFLPVMNPDGYQFTFDDDRLWRKNRYVGNNCMGVDLNRNYDWRWGMDGGSSPLECSETFRGPTPASEPETQAVQNYISGLVDEDVGDGATQFEAFLTFHTYGYYWLVPFGNCEDPPNGESTLQVAYDTARAIELSDNTAWLDGNSCRVLYATDGGSSDWAKGAAGAEHVYTPELRGPFFTPGVDAIPLSVAEIWAGLVEMFASIDRN